MTFASETTVLTSHSLEITVAQGSIGLWSIHAPDRRCHMNASPIQSVRHRRIESTPVWLMPTHEGCDTSKRNRRYSSVGKTRNQGGLNAIQTQASRGSVQAQCGPGATYLCGEGVPRAMSIHAEKLMRPLHSERSPLPRQSVR